MRLSRSGVDWSGIVRSYSMDYLSVVGTVSVSHWALKVMINWGMMNSSFSFVHDWALKMGSLALKTWLQMTCVERCLNELRCSLRVKSSLAVAERVKLLLERSLSNKAWAIKCCMLVGDSWIVRVAVGASIMSSIRGIVMAIQSVR